MGILVFFLRGYDFNIKHIKNETDLIILRKHQFVLIEYFVSRLFIEFYHPPFTDVYRFLKTGSSLHSWNKPHHNVCFFSCAIGFSLLFRNLQSMIPSIFLHDNALQYLLDAHFSCMYVYIHTHHNLLQQVPTHDHLDYFHSLLV